MKALNKAQRAQRADIAQKLYAAQEAAEAALQEARDFLDELYAAQESYWSERSERWQRSDAGQNYTAWMEELEGLRERLDGIDFDDLANQLDDLADSPEG